MSSSLSILVIKQAIGDGLRSAKKSVQTGFCELFRGLKMMQYLEGDFFLRKAKAPAAVLKCTP